MKKVVKLGRPKSRIVAVKAVCLRIDKRNALFLKRLSAKKKLSQASIVNTIVNELRKENGN